MPFGTPANEPCAMSGAAERAVKIRAVSCMQLITQAREFDLAAADRWEKNLTQHL